MRLLGDTSTNVKKFYYKTNFTISKVTSLLTLRWSSKDLTPEVMILKKQKKLNQNSIFELKEKAVVKQHCFLISSIKKFWKKIFRDK